MDKDEIIELFIILKNELDVCKKSDNDICGSISCKECPFMSEDGHIWKVCPLDLRRI